MDVIKFTESASTKKIIQQVLELRSQLNLKKKKNVKITFKDVERKGRKYTIVHTESRYLNSMEEGVKKKNFPVKQFNLNIKLFKFLAGAVVYLRSA